MRLAFLLLNRFQLKYPHKKALPLYVIQQGVLLGLLLFLPHAWQSPGVALLLLPQAGSVLSPAEDLAEEYTVGVCT